MKQKSGGIKRLMEFTGKHRGLLTVSRILSGISSVFILGPFLCVYFAARDLVGVFAGTPLSNWKRSLKAAFYTAIEDDCIRKNPFNFAIADVLEDDTEEKAALTQDQEDRLLAFAGSDPVYRKYCDEIIVLLGTGLRVSELCGLTTDLDFENRCIHVDHQLLRDSELGYYVDEPKTKKGARQIPMSEKVYQALKRAVKNRGKAAPVNIGGYTNFLFLNQSGLPKTASCYESMFQGLVRKYNKHHKPE